jgi:hypothetical protein
VVTASTCIVCNRRAPNRGGGRCTWRSMPLAAHFVVDEERGGASALSDCCGDQTTAEADVKGPRCVKSLAHGVYIQLCCVAFSFLSSFYRRRSTKPLGCADEASVCECLVSAATSSSSAVATCLWRSRLRQCKLRTGSIWLILPRSDHACTTGWVQHSLLTFFSKTGSGSVHDLEH